VAGMLKPGRILRGLAREGKLFGTDRGPAGPDGFWAGRVFAPAPKTCAMFAKTPCPRHEADVEPTRTDQPEEGLASTPQRVADGAPASGRAEQLLAELKDSIRRSEELIRTSQEHLR